VEGDTSSIECAHQLGKLCENRHLIVNLIPYNQTDVKDKLRCPSDAHMRKFRDIVTSYKTFCTIRRTMGADIDSACGQLVVAKEKEAKQKQADIEDTAQMNYATNSKQPKVVKRSSAIHSKSMMKDTSNLNSDLDHLVKPLAIATSILATCFIGTTILFFKQRRR